MKEITLNNKKNGMMMLLLTLALYVVAIVGLVFGVIELVCWVIAGLIFVFPFILLFFGALFA